MKNIKYFIPFIGVALVWFDIPHTTEDIGKPLEGRFDIIFGSWMSTLAALLIGLSLLL